MSDIKKQTYLDYKFLGVTSLIKTLEDNKQEYQLFKEDDFSSLFKTEHDILKEGDTVNTGFITRDDQKAYFTEFGIKLTKNYYSYIVFIFDHHPITDELLNIVASLEKIVMANLDNLDISKITEKN